MPQPPNNPPKQALIPQGAELVLNQDGSVSWRPVAEPPPPDPPPEPPGIAIIQERRRQHEENLKRSGRQQQMEDARADREAQEAALRSASEDD
jgi:hypothetical protein